MSSPVARCASVFSVNEEAWSNNRSDAAVCATESLDPSKVRSSIPTACYRKTLAAPLAMFVLAMSLYFATWFAIFQVQGLGKIGIGILNGICISIVFIIGHDACHGALVSPRWLNELIGRLAFLPSLHPLSYWEFGHNRLHHGWTNYKPKDYGWAPLSKEEFDDATAGRRLVETVGRTFFGVTLYYLVVVWWTHMAFPRAEDKKHVSRWVGLGDRLSVLAFLVGQIVVGSRLEAGAGGGAISHVVGAAFFGIIVPFAIWNWMVGFLTFMHHTHERVRWYADRDEWSFAAGALLGTVHVEFPRVVDLILQNIMFHTAHHVDTRIPLYGLPDAQCVLESAYGERVVRVLFDTRSVARTFRKCKLYDYQAHRWLDFNGNPTD
jgi:omega-6 fatty acid desaturase (delta-12 desaturase)